MWILRGMSIAIATSFFSVGMGSAQEKKIKRSDLPLAVEKTVVEVTKGAIVKGFNEEKEEAKTSYEVEMIVNGHSKDVQIDPSGTVTEVEEAVGMDALSPDVKAGLAAKAGAGKIVHWKEIGDSSCTRRKTTRSRRVRIKINGEPPKTHTRKRLWGRGFSPEPVSAGLEVVPRPLGMTSDV